MHSLIGKVFFFKDSSFQAKFPYHDNNAFGMREFKILMQILVFGIRLA